MFFPSVWTDATKTAMAMMEASMENVRATQDAVLRQTEILSKAENLWTVKWTGSPVPFPVLSFKSTGMEASRETFHLMADVNLSAWESTAKAYAAAPAWVKLPYKAPGDFWAKWFDQFQQGKFDTPFTGPVSSVFEKLMPTSFVPGKAANETEASSTQFKLESPADTSGAVQKPVLLSAANGKADDLTQLKGIGQKLQKTLNDLGIFHLSQIASWTPENIAWLDDRLAFKGRIHREGWVEQAQNLLKSAA